MQPSSEINTDKIIPSKVNAQQVWYHGQMHPFRIATQVNACFNEKSHRWPFLGPRGPF